MAAGNELGNLLTLLVTLYQIWIQALQLHSKLSDWHCIRKQHITPSGVHFKETAQAYFRFKTC